MKNCFKNLETCPFHPITEKMNKAFVLMPFTKDFDKVYRVGIKDSLEEIGWACDRSDERWDTPEVVCTICKSIQEASLIIVDVTGKNTNVFLELGLSFGVEKNILLLTQNISDLPFDIRTFRVIKYTKENVEELQMHIQKAIRTLKPAAPKDERPRVFEENVNHHKSFFENSDKPMMQIFIGSKNSRERWLEPSEENRHMLLCAPDFLRIKDVVARFNYYTFESYYEYRYLQIYPDGFIISHFPSVVWAEEKGIATIHELIYYISGMFIFANRIMKHKTIDQSQRIRIELWNLKDIPVQIDIGPEWSHREYTFAESPIVIEEEFNPNSDWRDLFFVLITIYRKICSHLGIQNIEENTIRTNLCKLLAENMQELHTYYTNSQIPPVPIDEMCKKD